MIKERIFKNNTHHWEARCKCKKVFYLNHQVMEKIRKQELFPAVETLKAPQSISVHYRGTYREEQIIFSFLYS